MKQPTLEEQIQECDEIIFESKKIIDRYEAVIIAMEQTKINLSNALKSFDC